MFGMKIGPIEGIVSVVTDPSSPFFGFLEENYPFVLSAIFGVAFLWKQNIADIIRSIGEVRKDRKSNECRVQTQNDLLQQQFQKFLQQHFQESKTQRNKSDTDTSIHLVKSTENEENE